MSLRQPLHWQEGMFLHPHHFQSFQRAVDEALVQERLISRSFGYGLVEFRLTEGALASKRVQFERLRVILPGGIEINVPENAELGTLDIKTVFDSSDSPIVVALAVPAYQFERPNLLDPAEPFDKRRYRFESVEVPDENTGENLQGVQLRRFNARLILNPEGTMSDMEVIPLFRIGRGVGEKLDMPVLDETYIPPLIIAHAWPPLRQRVEGVTARARATHDQLMNRMIGEGFNPERMQGPQMHQLLKLQTLARQSARLMALVSSNAVRPFEWYLELKSCAAELLALEPGRKEDDVPDYNHDDLTFTFQKLFAVLDRLLVAQVKVKYRTVEFKPAERMRLATLSDDDVRLPNEYFLAVESKLNPQQIVGIVQDRVRFKVMSERKAFDAVYGIDLREERAPSGLPTPANVYYFRLLYTGDDYSKQMWKSIQTEKKIAIRWPNMDQTDFNKLTLYMLVPEAR